MSVLITNIEHALATAASEVVKTAKFVETAVLSVLKKAQAEASTIESVTALVSPQAANIERAGFAVLGVVINALDECLNVTLDAQLVADIKSIAAAVKAAVPVCGGAVNTRPRSVRLIGPFKHVRLVTYAAKR